MNSNMNYCQVKSLWRHVKNNLCTYIKNLIYLKICLPLSKTCFIIPPFLNNSHISSWLQLKYDLPKCFLWLLKSEASIQELCSHNTRPADLPLEKSVCRSGSNSWNWTWNNRLVPNRKRSTSRLYIVTLLI